MFTIQTGIALDDFRKSAPIGVSPLGTLIFDDLYFPNGVSSEGKEYEGLHIISASVSVSQAKNIVQTKIAGQDGTIKEFVSMDDYVITVSAKITENLNVFPAEQLATWRELANVSENLQIQSKFLNEYFEIYKVVVKDFSVDTIQGSLNEVNLNFTLISDNDIDLDLYLN